MRILNQNDDDQDDVVVVVFFLSDALSLSPSLFFVVVVKEDILSRNCTENGYTSKQCIYTVYR